MDIKCTSVFLFLLTVHFKSCESIVKPAPYSTDPEAIAEREACDYNIKITLEMAKAGKAPRKIRVYADGIYDLFHPGHANQLLQAKNAFPDVHLIVGVCNDVLTHARKGKTVMKDVDRYQAVSHSRYVDEVLTDAPWEITDEFLEKNKIDFVAHDDVPYLNENGVDIYQLLKDRDMFYGTQRTEGVSTSDLISSIVRDYDDYVKRNLKRGYNRKDMNVSFVKANSIKLKGKIDEIKIAVNEKKEDMLHMWEDVSKEFMEQFIHLFGRDGQVTNYFNDRKGKILRSIPSPEKFKKLLHLKELIITSSDSESHTESETESETESQTESETESQTESETELQTESETEWQTISQTESDTESQTESEIEWQTKSQIESKLKSSEEYYDAFSSFEKI
ncbi:putative choline-phosphate cytidylyltransferase [Daktulosphaira vitifoliae]|uniref:putative choline-phosphate cytidylyltransferase n=1 Tax=Daktulosphaira vitifoliae TaxID=58002 RepID=UPI0021AA5D52|nr:putative choline-phosphate cytidylyltransferase [Daktulosphaira vitifoliae]